MLLDYFDEELILITAKMLGTFLNIQKRSEH